MPMKNPPHPGRIVRQDCIEALELTMPKAAKLLGVTQPALNNLVNKKAGISAEMAIRLEKIGWSTADHWMRLQAAYELAQARAKHGQPWTKKDTQQIGILARKGVNTDDIAGRLGRTKAAIYSRASKENISVRPKDKPKPSTRRAA